MSMNLITVKLFVLVKICHVEFLLKFFDKMANKGKFQKIIIQTGRPISYQASSPDEVALVQWSEEMGLALIERTLTSMKLRTPVEGKTIFSYVFCKVNH